MNITISGEALAWYAAIAATLSAFAATYAIWRDRPRAKVSVQANMQMIGSSERPDKGHYLVISVANVGRRPITLTELPYFRVKRGKGERGDFAVTGPWIPKQSLGEGENADLICPQEALLQEANTTVAGIAAVYVRDATGRHWKGRLRKS